MNDNMLFINFMREKGVEPTENDIKHFEFMVENKSTEDIDRYNLVKQTLEAKEAGFVEGDISGLLFSIVFDWDIEKVQAELEAV